MNIKAVLFDLSGVLYIDDQAIDGAIDSIHALRQHGVPHCFITNTTRRSCVSIEQTLQQIGFDIRAEEIFTASSAALEYICRNKLQPFTLVHKNLRADFSSLHTTQANAVLLGDAADDFNYDNLNQAFRVLMQHPDTRLLSMGYNRYFKEADGLSLDLGAFTSALEFASGKRAIILGKPSADFFQQAVSKLHCQAEQVLMIGDDVESDVNGAIDAGLQGCLVKTGKYQPGDENTMRASGLLMADVNQAVDWVIRHSA